MRDRPEPEDYMDIREYVAFMLFFFERWAPTMRWSVREFLEEWAENMIRARRNRADSNFKDFKKRKYE